MSRSTLLDYSFALLCAAGCSQAYADQPIAGPQLPQARIALDVAPAKVRAPYDVQVIRENGETAPTYAFRDRFYVQGNVNERYIIRVSNPTANRVEAVVTVDGLDVIDGENGDLRKRGYVVPAYGETRIEGFRTSEADVATFRFSSVGGSYAGMKGKARNVGVIAVAIFEEQHAVEEQQIIVGQAGPPMNRRYDYRDDLDARRAPAPSTADAGERLEVQGTTTRGYDRPKASPGDAPTHGHRIRGEKKTAAADKAPEPTPSAPTAGGAGRAMPAPPPAKYQNYDADEEGADCCEQPNYQPAPQHERLGLGTEFGEQRYSAAQYTRFVRANNRPIAIAELRYNDAAGLMALGINIGPMPDQGEIMTRETADPFPGDNFAKPPY